MRNSTARYSTETASKDKAQNTTASTSAGKRTIPKETKTLKGSSNIIAIDPGMNGGIVMDYSAVKMPPTMTGIFDLLKERSSSRTYAVIEKVGSYVPGNSGPSAVKFARHNGHLEMALYALGIPTTFVLPTVWMRGIGVPTKLSEKDRKNWIKDFVKKTYPFLNVTLWNADAYAMFIWATEKLIDKK